MTRSSVGTVVPCLDPTYLQDALRSLRDQTVAHEIIVVDDGSPGADASRIAREFGVRVLRNDSPAGPAAARNQGIRELEHEWILNFDADNVAEPAFLERLLRVGTRRKGVGIAYCRVTMIGDAQGPYETLGRGLPWHLAEANFIDASSLFRRTAWEEAGGFDPSLAALEDWDLWLSIVERGWKLAYVPDRLLRYRVRAGSRTRTAASEMDAITAAILHKHAAYVRQPHRRRLRNVVPRLVTRVRRILDDRR